jgi:hypothetical protein
MINIVICVSTNSIVIYYQKRGAQSSSQISEEQTKLSSQGKAEIQSLENIAEEIVIHEYRDGEEGSLNS